MRPGLLLVLFLFSSAAGEAMNPYRTYLLAQINTSLKPLQQQPHKVFSGAETTTDACIPRYQIPKGNIFCRMEDKLTKSARVWIKIGVQ